MRLVSVLVLVLSLGVACGPHTDNGDDDDDNNNNNNDNNTPPPVGFSLPDGLYTVGNAQINSDSCSITPLDPADINGSVSDVSSSGTTVFMDDIELTRTGNTLTGSSEGAIPAGQCTLNLTIGVDGDVVADEVMDMNLDQGLTGTGTCVPADLNLAQLPCALNFDATLTFTPTPS